MIKLDEPQMNSILNKLMTILPVFRMGTDNYLTVIEETK